MTYDFPDESYLDLTLLSCWVVVVTCVGWGIWKGIKRMWGKVKDRKTKI